MKTLILPILILVSASTWADCNNPKSNLESQKCLNNEVRDLKSELGEILNSAYNQTDAKKEFNAAQSQWLKYKELQCGNFVVADANGSPSTMEYDLTCQSILYKQRIQFLKDIFN